MFLDQLGFAIFLQIIVSRSTNRLFTFIVYFLCSALVTAFEKAKKKYQGKLKKLEMQMAAMSERYESQVSHLSAKYNPLEYFFIKLNPLMQNS